MKCYFISSELELQQPESWEEMIRKTTEIRKLNADKARQEAMERTKRIEKLALDLKKKNAF